MTQPIEDYISNVDTRTISTIDYVEEFLAPSPITQGEYDNLYELYSVTFEDGTSDKYIISRSDAATIAFKATKEALEELFPHHIE